MCLKLRHLRMAKVWQHICQTAPSGSSVRRPGRVLRVLEICEFPRAKVVPVLGSNAKKPFCNVTAKFSQSFAECSPGQADGKAPSEEGPRISKAR